MKPKIVKEKDVIEKEFRTPELCSILENWSEAKRPDVSIARARVEKGITTRLHYLKGVDEIYLIVQGKGMVKVGSLSPAEVVKGDLVFIPAGAHQQMSNIGDSDLIFYCICTPRFTPECYMSV